MDPQKIDYSFIAQSNNSGKPQVFAPKSQKQRIMLVGFIAVSIFLVGIVIMIAINLFTVDNTKKLTDLALLQNELQLITERGSEESRDGSLRAVSQTASSTLASHKQNTINLASKKNIKITDKQLAANISKEINEALDKAKSANNFDDVYVSIYDSRLASYGKKIKELYESESDKTIKTALNTYYSGSLLLAKDYKATTQN